MERPKFIIVGFENIIVNEKVNDSSTFDIMDVNENDCKIGSDFILKIGNYINYGVNT